MKKIGELMNEMGFNLNSNDATKEAFIKYLVKKSTGINIVTPSEQKEIDSLPEKVISLAEQICFDFEEKKRA